MVLQKPGEEFYIPIDYFCLEEKAHLWVLAEDWREQTQECVLKKQKLPSMCFVNPGTIPVGAVEAQRFCSSTSDGFSHRTSC